MTIWKLAYQPGMDVNPCCTEMLKYCDLCCHTGWHHLIQKVSKVPRSLETIMWTLTYLSAQTMISAGLIYSSLPPLPPPPSAHTLPPPLSLSTFAAVSCTHSVYFEANTCGIAYKHFNTTIKLLQTIKPRATVWSGSDSISNYRP